MGVAFRPASPHPSLKCKVCEFLSAVKVDEKIAMFPLSAMASNPAFTI
jgi:hypothetical protein